MSQASDGEPAGQGRRTGKSAEAFRTISEVSDELDVPQHVLRFWETKFTQVRPLKRAGGRRYYRPEDVALLRAIRDLLYRDGYTIKGAQKLLREGGARSQVAARPGPIAASVRHDAKPADDRPPAAASAVMPQGSLPFAAGSGSDDPAEEEFTVSRAELEALIEELAAIRDILRRTLG